MATGHAAFGASVTPAACPSDSAPATARHRMPLMTEFHDTGRE